MVWYWTVWEIMVNILENSMIAFFLYARLGCIPARRKWFLFIPSLYVVLITVENFLGLPSQVTMPACFVMWVLFSILVCSGSIASRVFWGCMVTVVIVFVNFTLVQASATLPSITVEETFTPSAVRLVMTTLYLILEAACYTLLLRIRAEEMELPKALTALLIGLTLVSVAAVALLTHLVVLMQGNRLEQIIALVTAFSLFLLTLGVSLSMSRSGRYLRQNQRMRTEIELGRLEKENMQSMVETMQAMREWRHDFHNHLQLLSFLLKQGDLNRMQEYLGEMGGRVEGLSAFISTGNQTVDALLSSKQMVARSHDIPVNAACSVPDGLPMDDLDLCVLLGNLMDNAIEANLALPKDMRGIGLWMHPEGGMFKIRVENPSTGQYLYDEEQQLKSTKQGGGHGIGLDHIRRMAERVQGFLTVNALESRFEVSLVLPIQEGRV